MTKKDYELIAREFNAAFNRAGDHNIRGKTIDDLAVLLAYSIAVNGDNPRFDQLRFLKACRIGTKFDDGGKAIQARDEYMMS